MGRTVILGLAMLAVAAFIGLDSFAKLAWPHVRGTVQAVDPKCEMKSEQYNVLTRTTYDATVDCAQVEAFKILHPDKEWTVRRTYLTQLKVAGANPVATSMVVYSEPSPKPGQVLDLIQDPKDALRVLKGDASASGFGAAGVAVIIGALLVVFRLVFRGLRRPPMAPPPTGGEPEPEAAPLAEVPARTAAVRRAAPGHAGGRVFGRR